MHATVIRAEADAEAARMVSDAIGKFGPGLVAMRKIEAAQFMAEQMVANPNINFVHGGNTMNML
jgi:prohibitin 1